jgi:hypothetical protein
VKETNTKVQLMVFIAVRKRGRKKGEEQQEEGEMMTFRPEQTAPTAVSKQNKKALNHNRRRPIPSEHLAFIGITRKRQPLVLCSK